MVDSAMKGKNQNRPREETLTQKKGPFHQRDAKVDEDQDQDRRLKEGEMTVEG